MLVLSRDADDRKATVLIDKDELSARIAALAQEIRTDFPSTNCICLRPQGRLSLPRRPDSRARWPRQHRLHGLLELRRRDLVVRRSPPLEGSSTASIEGRDVIVIEDIVDTGLTLHYLQEILLGARAAVAANACLLSKPSRRKIDVKVDYIGFTIEDKFVVGYGLDYAEQYRNLPYIGVLE
jgi:hypoxanthine phosphoribosyltransferase